MDIIPNNTKVVVIKNSVNIKDDINIGDKLIILDHIISGGNRVFYRLTESGIRYNNTYFKINMTEQERLNLKYRRKSSG